MKEKNPVMLLFPLQKARKINESFLIIGRTISKIVFSLDYDLKKSEIDISSERYAFAAFISAVLYGVMFLFVGMAFGVIITRSFTSQTIIIMLL
jgi:hypothetical protein